MLGQVSLADTEWSQGGEVGGFGGGWLEHPRQWLGAPSAGRFLERRASHSCQARPGVEREPGSGTA